MVSRFTPYIYILFFSLLTEGIYAQRHTLIVKPNSRETNEVIDAIQFTDDIGSKDSVQTGLDSYFKRIELKGFLNASLDSVIQNDSTSTAYIDPGIQLQWINIRYDHIPRFEEALGEMNGFNVNKEGSFLNIPFMELTDFMNSLVVIFEKKGYSFTEISLRDIEIINNEAWATVHLDQKTMRNIDKVVIKGYEKFPGKFISREMGLEPGSVFNRDKIERASRSLNLLPFASEQKPPEILFTNDSTIVYLYIRREKSNQFDGILGFASAEEGGGLEFNGYLDLAINNIFNGGETIALYWKSNGQNRQRFYLETEIPYLFNLPLTPKINFELYRQDSTFSNQKMEFSLRYHLRGMGRIAATFSAESSNDLTNGQTTGVDSYNNLFYGLAYSFRIPTADPLFPAKLQLDASGLLGHRQGEDQSTNQQKLLLRANYLYSLNSKNFVFVQNSSGLLNSEDYYENELFRIGGIYNLRGVNEESIFATTYTIFNVEYRYKPNALSYFYSITDYAYTSNKRVEVQSNIWSLGLGYGFQTKAGILNLSYAIGKFEGSPFSFDNSKIHVKMVSKF